MNVCMFVCMYVCLYACMHVYMHAYTYIHTNTFMNTYTFEKYAGHVGPQCSHDISQRKYVYVCVCVVAVLSSYYDHLYKYHMSFMHMFLPVLMSASVSAHAHTRYPK